MSKIFPPCRNFYMMRHAETEDNKNKVVSGRASVTTLTEEGRRQAKAKQALLMALDPPIDYIVTSEMQRTQDTAKILCDSPALSSLHIYVESGINERAYGAAEGLSDDERNRVKNAVGNIEGEESKEDLRLRTIKAVAASLLQRKGIPLFISHGGNIRRVLEEALGRKAVEQKNVQVVNCGLYEFIAPKTNGENWVVNMLTLDGNKVKRSEWLN